MCDMVFYTFCINNRLIVLFRHYRISIHMKLRTFLFFGYKEFFQALLTISFCFNMLKTLLPICLHYHLFLPQLLLLGIINGYSYSLMITSYWVIPLAFLAFFCSTWCNFVFKYAFEYTPPSSLIDSNVSPRWTQQKNEELGYTPWFTGKGACCSSKIGLGRMTSKSITRTNLHKPNNKLVNA